VADADSRFRRPRRKRLRQAVSAGAALTKWEQKLPQDARKSPMRTAHAIEKFQHAADEHSRRPMRQRPRRCERKLPRWLAPHWSNSRATDGKGSRKKAPPSATSTPATGSGPRLCEQYAGRRRKRGPVEDQSEQSEAQIVTRAESARGRTRKREATGRSGNCTTRGAEAAPMRFSNR